MPKSQAFLTTGTAIFGMATLGIAAVMMFTFPREAELADGFRTPVIAFEFATTETDLGFLTGSDEAATRNREKMDAGHAWDMVFPFAYAGFIVLLLLSLTQKGYGLGRLGILVALAIIPLDINENLVLLRITEALENGASVQTLLPPLYPATWLKWGALSISMLILSIGFGRSKQYVSATFAALTGLGIAACWFSGTKPAMAELMSLLTSLGFLVLVAGACRQAIKLRFSEKQHSA